MEDPFVRVTMFIGMNLMKLATAYSRYFYARDAIPTLLECQDQIIETHKHTFNARLEDLNRTLNQLREAQNG